MFKKKLIIIIFLFAILLIGGFFLLVKKNTQVAELFPRIANAIISSAKFDNGYYELLVKTSDNKGTNDPVEERAGNAKQGYIILVRSAGWNWGNLELDPKSFAIIKIPKSKWNESWLEVDYDYENPIAELNETCYEICLKENGKDCESKCQIETGKYEILTQRKYRLPLETFMNESEINTWKDIPYNSEVEWEIRKDVSNIAEKIELVDWENRPEDVKLHGSSGYFEICEAGAPTCNYTSLLAWETAQDDDLTGNGPCIANITGVWTSPESGRLDVSGWTTTASDYILITTDEQNRAQKTGWNASRYIMNESIVDYTLVLYEDYTRINGLQIGGTGVGITIVDLQTAGTNYIEITNNRISGKSTGIYAVTDKIDRLVINNNVIFNISGNCIRYGFGGFNITTYNNVLVNCTTRGVLLQHGNVTFKNNVIHNTGDDILDDGSGTSLILEYNAADDDLNTEFGESTNIQPSNWNNEYSVPGSENFTLIDGGDLSDAGIGSASDNRVPLLDIDGDTRDVNNPDIGADEYISDVDSINPDINITFPINNTEHSNVNLDVNFTRSDDTALHSCWYSNDTYLKNSTSDTNCGNVTAIVWSVGNHNVTVWVNDTSGNLNWSKVTFNITADTCTCAGLNNNWEVDMSDYCELDDDCNLGTGKLSFTGNGYANCTAKINTTNLGDPGSGGTLYISDGCLINVKG